MRTPVSALVMISSLLGTNSLCTGSSASAENAADGCLLLLQYALRIEVADAAALRARRRIDHCVDQSGLARIYRDVDCALQFIRGGGIDADAAKRLHHLVVSRTLDEHGGCGIRACRVGVGAAIDAVIVEDDDADREVVAADCFDLHAGEAERAVALDRKHRLAGLDAGCDRRAHPDAHHAPGADVEPLARLIH